MLCSRLLFFGYGHTLAPPFVFVIVSCHWFVVIVSYIRNSIEVAAKAAVKSTPGSVNVGGVFNRKHNLLSHYARTAGYSTAILPTGRICEYVNVGPCDVRKV